MENISTAVSLTTAIIFNIYALRIWRKHYKGIPLKSYEKIAAVVAPVLGGITFFAELPSALQFFGYDVKTISDLQGFWSDQLAWTLIAITILAVSVLITRPLLKRFGYKITRIDKAGEEVVNTKEDTVTILKPATIGAGTLEAYTRGDEQQAKPFAAFLSEAQKTIDMVGITLNRAAREQVDIIESAVKRGVKVTVLVLDPDAPITKRIANEWGSPRLPTDIEQTLLTLNALREKLGEFRSFLELRTYDHVPNVALTILDQHENNAKLRMSNYIHGVDPNLKIGTLASKDKNETESKVLEKYSKEYQIFYGVSRVISYEKYSNMEKVRSNSVPIFEARIVNKKTVYRIHDSVQFESHYRGTATNSFFDNFIKAPEGQTFPDDGKPYKYVADFRTFDIERNRGLMSGLVDEPSSWNFVIEPNYPKGVYKVEMRLYHQSSLLDLRTRQHIAPIPETFEVV